MIKLRKLLLENNQPNYCGLYIDPENAKVLLDALKKQFPDQFEKMETGNWTFFIHHMTIHPFQNCKELKISEGTNVTLTLGDFRMNEKVCAVSVSGYTGEISKKVKYPHITIATNPHNKGKPFHSNELENGLPINPKITVETTVKSFYEATPKLSIPK